MKPKDQIKNDFSDKFKALLGSIRNNEIDNCPPAELLYRFFNKELSGKEKKIFEDHLDLCPLCFSALEGLKTARETEKDETSIIENWSKIEKTLNEKFYSSLESIPMSEVETSKAPNRKKSFDVVRTKWSNFLDIFLTPKIMAYAGSVAILLVIVFYSIAYFNRSNYFYLAAIEPEKQTTLRAETTTSSTLTEGLKLFADGKYKIAIEKFDTFLINNPDSYTANFYLGLSFLNISKAGLPGLPYKFDRQKVNKGVKYLEVALSNAGENQFYQEDCYWFLGKAYLMIGEVDNAKIQFNKILNLGKINLMRKEEAREMVSVLK